MNIPRKGLVSRSPHVLDERIKGSTAGAQRISVPAIAKRNSAASPYCVPNEYICAEIGRQLGLPIPPGAIISDTNGNRQQWYVALDFSPNGEPLEIVSPEDCFRDFPELCVGIILFDILIANGDRSVKNLYLDETLTPSEMRIFDHEVALLGATADQAEGRLTGSLNNRLGIEEHCLKHLVTAQNLIESDWIENISQLSHSFFERLGRNAQQYGITEAETDAVVNFLKNRRAALPQIIESNAADFDRRKRR